MRERRIPLHAAALAAASLLALSACDDGDEFDTSQQIGPDPVLPEPQSPLIANV
jgi:hypothetical protein